jgi:NAD(P)-dependent dehydrogenase (short-subunit alcohol dehydrogenase family)
MSLDQFHNTIDVNLTGCFLFAREFLRSLKASGATKEAASIVLVGSTCTRDPDSQHHTHTRARTHTLTHTC